MNGGFLAQALVFLAAAIIFVPIAKKIGMGSVLGYLIAGVMIGPFVFGFIGSEGHDIMHAAEFGVVMMLFLIGLELNPKEFWGLRKTIAGLGSIQMGLTSVILTLIGFFVVGWTLSTAISVGLALSMSSTAIILQTLKEKGLERTIAGQSSFSVLLFQDIMVIPILALLPLLSAIKDSNTASDTYLDLLPEWLRPIAILSSIVFIYFSGRFFINPLLKQIAKIKLRELFTATALFLVIAVAYLMQIVGLSPALGAFLAGVVLANSEYRHELESDLEPFKGLLLGLFFIGVGATINFPLIIEKPLLIIAFVGVIMFIKGLVLYITGKVFGMRNDQDILFVFLMSQVGEFAFVLVSFSNQLHIVNKEWTDVLMAVVAITMVITPIMLLIYDKWIDPYFGIKEIKNENNYDDIKEENKIILAGFGHFGSTIGRFLRANGIEATILDNDSDRVELLRKMGFKVYYGDATRVDLLKSAGAEKATLLVAAIDSPIINQTLIANVRKHFPNLKIMARARNRFDAYELIDMDVKHIYRETLYTAVHMAVDVLKEVGVRAYTATRIAQDFIKYDEEALIKLSKSRHDMKEYIISAKEQIEMQEKLLNEDLHHKLTTEDHAWDSEEIRNVINNSKI
jgi:monovalent cation:H+ antiporter-2, CPA2 family